VKVKDSNGALIKDSPYPSYISVCKVFNISTYDLRKLISSGNPDSNGYYFYNYLPDNAKEPIPNHLNTQRGIATIITVLDINGNE